MFREGDEQVSNAIIAESKIKAMKDADSELKFERAVLNNQDAFLVTSVVHLPFVKNDVISESEYKIYNQKYPKRFQTVEETETLEDPCYIVINGGESPFERADIILEREETICAAYDKTFEAGIGQKVFTRFLNRWISISLSPHSEKISQSAQAKETKTGKEAAGC